MATDRTNNATVPTREETNEARIGEWIQGANCALIPAWNGSIAPATNANRKYNATTVRATFAAVCSSPATRPGRHHAQLRRHRPAGSAVPADDRALPGGRRPRVRVRLDVRLAHPLGGVLRDTAAGSGADEQDQARALRHEPRYPRPDDHCELVRDDAGHLRRPHGDGDRPR